MRAFIILSIAVLNHKRKHKITLDIIELRDKNGEEMWTKMVFGALE